MQKGGPDLLALKLVGGSTEKMNEDVDMMIKNGIFILIVMTSFGLAKTSYAIVFPDQEVRGESSEDENADTTSSFGNFNHQKRHADSMVPRTLAPISDASFDRSPGRAPASMGSRNPAGTNEVVIQAKRVSASRKAILRHVKQSKAYQEVAVIANDLGFFPSTLFLTQGVPVRLYVTGASVKSQCFILDQFGVRRQIRNQKIEEITFTPDQTGTFSFNCPMNGAKGSVVVKEIELGASERAPASVDVSDAREAEVPKPEKKSEISDQDFQIEFRN